MPPKYRFERRSRRPADDLFNAALNFGYGLLYKEVDKALILAGLSPFVGFLHRDGYQNRALTFDFIEQYRVWVDRVVFRLFSRKRLQFLHIHPYKGGFLLNNEGKQLVVRAYEEFVNKETLIIEDEFSSNRVQIKLDAQHLANQLHPTAKK